MQWAQCCVLCVKSKRNSVEPLCVSFDTVAEKIAEQTGDIAKDLEDLDHLERTAPSHGRKSIQRRLIIILMHPAFRL